MNLPADPNNASPAVPQTDSSAQSAGTHSSSNYHPAESPVSTSASSAESPPRPPEYYWDNGLLAPGDRARPPEGLEKYLEVRREQQSREKRGRSDAGSSKLISDDKPDNSPPPKMGKFPKM